MTMSGICGEEDTGANAQVGTDVERVATTSDEKGQPGTEDIVD